MLVWNRWSVALLGAALVVAAGCGDDGGGPDSGTIDPDAMVMLDPIDIIDAALVQTMAPMEVRAGEVIPVTCTILDENGEVYSSAGRTPRIRVSPEGSVERMDGMITAVRVGTVEVSCAFPDLMLTDETPALVNIIPGEPSEVITSVDRNSVDAGGTVNATCDVFDAHGNRVDDAEPTLSTTPSSEGTTVDGLSATLTEAGIYEFSCTLPGTTTTPQRVEVTPSLPAALVVAKVPDQPVYGIGQVIEVVAIVTDQYGNEVVDAPVGYVSNPAAGAMIGSSRFRYFEDGTFVVTVTVAPPTEGDVVLSQDVTIVVNGNGPQIQCDNPADGQMINVAPGGTLNFQGSVDDSSGVDSVMVNGTAATLDGSGGFSIPVTVDFGINFLDIVATDSFGEESSRTCAFLASDRWAPPGDVLGDTVALGLGQGAIDDMDPAGSVDSLDDLLHTVVNSPGLRNTLHTSLLANNPLKPRSCDYSTFLGCVFRSEINYLDSQLNGPNRTELTLIDGGMHALVRLENVRIRLDVDTNLGDTEGWATISYVQIELDFAAGLSGGRPTLTVVPGSVDVESGSISTSFSGIDGFFINIIVDLLQNTVRGMVEDALTGFVEDNFNELLDGVVGSLDISSLGSVFTVPRLDGSGNIDLNFGVGFSSISPTASRLLFGIGTRFTGPTAIGRPTLGVAVPHGGTAALRDDPNRMGRTASVSIHLGLFNQVLHALWRGGLLEATIDSSTLGGDSPDGLSAVVSGALPPVAVMNVEGDVELGIGTLAMQLTYPGIFDDPIFVVLGARASTDVALSGNDITFGTITVEELYFSAEGVSLDMSTRETLERFFTSLVQSIVDGALNDALPALPIPSFTLPTSVADFGLTPGMELGITSPALATERPHFVLRGNFGEL
ncbi:MAG: hypothetical protein JJ863_10210 [Deltaproteobacteria bacterium]|nr:hypothetical protein [Deltaproteobacteria bacterium]